MAMQAIDYDIAESTTRFMRKVLDLRLDVERAYTRLKTRRALAALSDEQLEDIGLTRWDAKSFD